MTPQLHLRRRWRIRALALCLTAPLAGAQNGPVSSAATSVASSAASSAATSVAASPAASTATSATTSMATSAPAPLPLSLALSRDSVAMPAGGVALLAALVLALMFSLAFAWYRKRPGRASKSGRFDWRALLQKSAEAQAIVVLGSTRLDLRAQLHTVEWEGRRLLIASGEHGVSLLAEVAGRPAAAASLSEVAS